MARGFGSTYGTGANDLVLTSMKYCVTQRSFFYWYIFNGLGGSSSGRFFQNGSGVGVPSELIATTGVTTAQLTRNFTTTAGVFTGTIPAASTAWHSMGISYDAGNTTNVPIMYIDGVSQNMTAGTSPVGTVLNGVVTGSLNIGNLANVRNFDGVLGEFTTWDTILSAREFVYLSKGMEPYFIRPQSISFYSTLTATNKDINKFRPSGPISVTATKLHTNPPLTYRWLVGVDSLLDNSPIVNSPILQGHVTAAPPATTAFRRTASRIGTRSGTRQTWAV